MEEQKETATKDYEENVSSIRNVDKGCEQVIWGRARGEV
jgi:hypothetical protein